jgi:hypothetical protein
MYQRSKLKSTGFYELGLLGGSIGPGIGFSKEYRWNIGLQKNVNNCLNINIYSLLETSGG